MLKKLLLSLLLLPVLVMAAPPPAGNWLEGLFAKKYWDLRLEIKLTDIRDYVSKITVPEMGCLKNAACGHLSSSVFAGLENNGMPKLEEINSIYAKEFFEPDSTNESAELLAKMTGKRVTQLHYRDADSAFEFIRNNIGRGDHVALTLKVFNNGKEEGHVFNIANLDGYLTVIDTAQYANGKHLMQPLYDVFKNKQVGVLKITNKSDYTIDFPLRDNRTYDFPVNSRGHGGYLSETDNREFMYVAGTYDSNTLKARLDQLNLCPKHDLSIKLPHI